MPLSETGGGERNRVPRTRARRDLPGLSQKGPGPAPGVGVDARAELLRCVAGVHVEGDASHRPRTQSAERECLGPAGTDRVGVRFDRWVADEDAAACRGQRSARVRAPGTGERIAPCQQTARTYTCGHQNRNTPHLECLPVSGLEALIGTCAAVVEPNLRWTRRAGPEWPLVDESSRVAEISASAARGQEHASSWRSRQGDQAGASSPCPALDGEPARASRSRPACSSRPAARRMVS
jgi:hypothetical protein